MDSLMVFLGMGGYAAYVWPALAVAAVVMIALLAQTLRSLRAREATLAALKEEPRGGGPAAEDA
ncbi:MAG: heme exporter protein CcmD [Alphaproteobacteria bacterium]